MNAYGKKAQKRQMRKAIIDEASAFVEHCDLIYLMLLHEKDGYGAVRLRRHFRDFVKLYDEYKERYLNADDLDTLGERGDTLALKKKLAEIGFDYDKEYALAMAEVDESRKKAD